MTTESERLSVTYPALSRLRGAMALFFASVVAFAACDTDPAPQVTFTATGNLEGLVFFDAGEDGIFDPSDGDIPVAGAGLAAQARGTGRTFAGGTAQTDAAGRFAITGLPLGTHDLVVDTTTVPDGVAICQNPLRFSITANETQFQTVPGRAGCLITIQAAKELALGSFAIVRGIVTGEPGQVDASRTYFQDGSAGALIFSGSLEGLGLALGDQIEIAAVTGEFSGEFQFVNPVTLRAVIEDVGELEAQLMTTAEVSASGATFTHPAQGRFIRLERARLTGAFGSIGNIQNAPIDDGSGGTVMRVDDGVADRNTLNTIFTVGLCYNIQGFAANFAGAGQIFPRSLADVEVVPCN